MVEFGSRKILPTLPPKSNTFFPLHTCSPNCSEKYVNWPNLIEVNVTFVLSAAASPSGAFVLRELSCGSQAAAFKLGGHLFPQAVEPERPLQYLELEAQHADLLRARERLSGARASGPCAVVEPPDVRPNFRQHGDAALVIDSHLQLPILTRDHVFGKQRLAQTGQRAAAQSERTYGDRVPPVSPKPRALGQQAHPPACRREQPVALEPCSFGGLLLERQAVRDDRFG